MPNRFPTKPEILFSLVLFFLCLANYYPSLKNNFVGDDTIFVGNEDAYRYQNWRDYVTVTQDQHYYPVYYLLNINLFRYFSDDPKILRLIALSLFYFSCLLLYRLILTLTQDQTLALIATTLFSLHPINSSHVLLISNSFLSVYILSLCASFIYFWHYLERPSHRLLNFILSIVFFILGLFSFEGAWLFPFCIMSALFFLKKESLQKSVKTSLPFIFCVLGHIFLWSTIVTQKNNLWARVASLNLTIGSYFASVAHLLKWYLANLFCPQTIVHIYNLHPVTKHVGVTNLMLLAICLALIFLAVKYWGRGLKSFALVWFLTGFLLLTAGCFSHAYMGMVVEPHWFSFSCIGFFLLLSVFLSDVVKKYSCCAAVSLIIILCLYWEFATQKYNNISSRQETYNEFWLKAAPLNPLPMKALAGIYANNKEPEKALNLYADILATSNYKRDEVYASMAKVYFNQRKYAESSLIVQKALQANSENAEAYYILAHLAYIASDDTKTEESFKKVLALAPFNIEAAFKLSDFYVEKGRINEAIAVLQKSWNSNPRGKEQQKILNKLQILKKNMRISN